MRICAIFVVGALLASCAPIPHWATYAPPYSGVVRNRRSEPVEGAMVTYRYRNALVIDRCTSGRDGAFELRPLRQFHYLVYLGSPGVAPFPIGLMYSSSVPNSITVTVDGKNHTYWIGSKMQYAAFAESSTTTARPFQTVPANAWLLPDARWIGDSPVVLKD